MIKLLCGLPIYIGLSVVPSVYTGHDIEKDRLNFAASDAAIFRSFDRPVGPGTGMSIPVDSPIFEQTDLSSGTVVTKTPTSLKFVRPIDTTDQRFVTPNIRDRARIAASWIEWIVTYGTTSDTSAPKPSFVLVDGVAAPVVASVGGTKGAYVVRTIRVALRDRAAHDVELIWPYDKPMEIIGRRVADDLVVSDKAPKARPAKLLVTAGDSLTQGFDVDNMGDQWAYLLARDIGYRLANQGYAGRVLVASDGAIYGAEGGAITTFMILANDVSAHTPLATVTSRLNAFWAGFFAAHPKGKNAKLLMISQPWMEAGDGGVPVSPSGPEYRAAMKSAVAAAAAAYPNLRYESGLDLSNGPGTTTDGTHLTSVTSRQQFYPRLKAHLKLLRWLP